MTDTAPGAFAAAPAYRTWWASLMTPPFNEAKGEQHRALARERARAWREWVGTQQEEANE